MRLGAGEGAGAGEEVLSGVRAYRFGGAEDDVLVAAVWVVEE